MKQLVISNYGMEDNFSFVVIDNLTKTEMGNNSSQLKKYGLYDVEWNCFDEGFIDFDENEKIQQFDMIIVCDDGFVRVYNQLIKYKENEGE